MQIIENVHHIPEVACNTYLIVEADGLTLIDAGLPGSTGKILDFVSSLGRTPHDLKRILITHSDWDHIGSLRPLHEAHPPGRYDFKCAGRLCRGGRRPSIPADSCGY